MNNYRTLDTNKIKWFIARLHSLRLNSYVKPYLIIINKQTSRIMIFPITSAFGELFYDKDQVSDSLGLTSSMKQSSRSKLVKTQQIFIDNRVNTHMKKWTILENKVYLQYLVVNAELFCDQKTKRRAKIFKFMSDQMLNTRSSQQCRGHHKKLFERHGSIQAIIVEVERKIKQDEAKKQVPLKQVPKNPNKQSQNWKKTPISVHSNLQIMKHVQFCTKVEMEEDINQFDFTTLKDIQEDWSDCLNL